MVQMMLVEAGEDSDNVSEDEGEVQPGAAAAGEGVEEAGGADAPNEVVADAADAAAEDGAAGNGGEAAAAGSDGAAADAAAEGS